MSDITKPSAEALYGKAAITAARVLWLDADEAASTAEREVRCAVMKARRLRADARKHLDDLTRLGLHNPATDAGLAERELELSIKVYPRPSGQPPLVVAISQPEDYTFAQVVDAVLLALSEVQS